MTWDYEEEGPHKCESTCTAELPSAIPQTQPPVVVAQPTPEPSPQVPEAPQTTPTTPTTPTTRTPAAATANAGSRDESSWLAVVVVAGVVALI